MRGSHCHPRIIEALTTAFHQSPEDGLWRVVVAIEALKLTTTFHQSPEEGLWRVVVATQESSIESIKAALTTFHQNHEWVSDWVSWIAADSFTMPQPMLRKATWKRNDKNRRSTTVNLHCQLQLSTRTDNCQHQLQLSTSMKLQLSTLQLSTSVNLSCRLQLSTSTVNFNF